MQPQLAAKGSLQRPTQLIRQKGYAVSTQAGTTTQNITQPGNMTGLVGIKIFSANSAVTNLAGYNFNLKVNSDLVLENTPFASGNPETLNNALGYLPIERPLSGSDNIEISTVATVATAFTFVFIFSQGQ